ncbi:hypothetical protein Dda_2887 [Drechslerella dactyloides]|uniref:Uncharacterized protein n=1 Tax=Drechslerella dactyloides TaxID=74499 RepID=A0AAD6J0E6_DREDA|nr:hypothetical protein Dda_2887 [Drechslerella dactyloides]
MSVFQSTAEIYPYRFLGAESTIPPLPSVDNVETMRAHVATKMTTGSVAFQFWKAMGEGVLKLQLKAFEAYHAEDALVKPWKVITDTVVSQKQLAILANHYGLRELLLPAPAERQAYMNTDKFTAELMLIFVSGYAATTGIDAPVTWVRDLLNPLIDGIFELYRRKQLEQGMQGLALSQNQGGRAAAAATAAAEPQPQPQPQQQQHQQPSVAPEEEEEEEPVYKLPKDARAEGTTQEEWQQQMSEGVAKLFDVGFDIHESQMEIKGTIYHNIILFVGSMEPVSMVRKDRDAAYEAALDAAAAQMATWF